MNSYRNQLVFVTVLVLAVFYVTVFGDICVVDDLSNLTDLANAQGITVKQIFLPHCAGGGYYRPLVWLSYLINLRLWDLNSMTLHLENVLLHIANVLLVYLLALSLLPRDKRQGRLIPLAAALIFGLHPITTESVDWISGRTDLIAGFFVLVAALMVVRYRRTRSLYLVAGAALSLLIGLMAKEVSLAFIPGALLLALERPDEEPGASSAQAVTDRSRDLICFLLFTGTTLALELLFFNFWLIVVAAPLYALVLYRQGRRVPDQAPAARVIPRLAAWGGAWLGAVGIVYAIRRIVFASDVSKIPETVKTMLEDPNHTISVFLGGIGFYCKKFLLPLPLNFAIREIDPAYSLIGTLLLFAGIAWAVRRTLPKSLVLTGVFLFAPALPLALGTVAWTAYAERYIYIPSAFWSIALVLWLAPRAGKLGRWGVAAVALLLLASGAVTLQRNLVWQKSLTLMRDTVAKSPRFREARAIYMGELMKAGDLKGATEQYLIASSLPSWRYDERMDDAMAQIFLMQGKDQEALRLYRTVYGKTKGSSETARRGIYLILERELPKAPPAAREELRRELQRYRPEKKVAQK